MYMRLLQLPYARQGVPHVAVVITDGQSQDWRRTEEQAKLAHDDGVIMYSVGVGPDVDEAELKKIASDETHVMESSSYAEINEITSQLKGQLCAESIVQCH